MGVSKMYSISVDAKLKNRVEELTRIKEERGRLVGIWHENLTGRKKAFRTGSMGEASFERWLDEGGFSYTDDQETNDYERYDYLVNGGIIDVKTRSGKYPYKKDYLWFVKANSMKMGIDYFAFCWHNVYQREAVLAGWLPYEDVLRGAKYYEKGDSIEKWSVPCDAYVMPGNRLLPMDELAAELRIRAVKDVPETFGGVAG